MRRQAALVLDPCLEPTMVRGEDAGVFLECLVPWLRREFKKGSVCHALHLQGDVVLKLSLHHRHEDAGADEAHRELWFHLGYANLTSWAMGLMQLARDKSPEVHALASRNGFVALVACRPGDGGVAAGDAWKQLRVQNAPHSFQHMNFKYQISVHVHRILDLDLPLMDFLPWQVAVAPTDVQALVWPGWAEYSKRAAKKLEEAHAVAAAKASSDIPPRPPLGTTAEAVPLAAGADPHSGMPLDPAEARAVDEALADFLDGDPDAPVPDDALEGGLLQALGQLDEADQTPRRDLASCNLPWRNLLLHI